MVFSNSNANPLETSRYKQGAVTYFHKGKTVISTLGSESFDNYIKDASKGEFALGRVPAGYEARPDLISQLFFGDTDSWWKLMIINSLNDPFEALKVGNQLLLPKD
jgi:hypothetical protein|tara:strand:+ start:1762 stop:2079 length:318 start_codon:yes stop_codon:yes gene_type:complete